MTLSNISAFTITLLNMIHDFIIHFHTSFPNALYQFMTWLPHAPLSLLSFTTTSLYALIFNIFLSIRTLKLFLFLETLLAPVLLVALSEIIVDWLKHAFITKFNQIKPNVYLKFRESLCRDLATWGDKIDLKPSSSLSSLSSTRPEVSQNFGIYFRIVGL